MADPMTRDAMEDAEFGLQMRNLLRAATTAEHSRRPDRDDIAETCRWAESRLRHYRAQDALRAAPPADAGAPQESNGKHERDSRPLYSQYQLDAATKPLHAEIERLRRDAGAPPALVALVQDLAERLNVMIRHRHEEAHNGDIYRGGSYEACPLCAETRDVIARAAAWTPAPPAPPPAGDRDATCAWDCALPYPHNGPCSAAPPAVQVGEPMPAIQVGDWVTFIDDFIGPWLVYGFGGDVVFLKGTGSVHRDRVSELRGERNGQPFIWRRREGA